MRLNSLQWWLLGIAWAIILFDQVFKQLAIASLEYNRVYPVLGDLLSWRLVFNDSAAFSIGFGMTWIFAVIGSLATLAILWFSFRITSRSWAVMFGVLLGGVVGNLIDRFTRDGGWGNGRVVDYIQIPFNFPVFNLADMAIVSIAVLTVLRIWRGDAIGHNRRVEA